jgi:DegV family protein with EDD domain
MAKIAIVTDSSAYIPDVLTHDLPIHVIPLILLVGDKTYKDGVDIQPDAFYSLMKSSTAIPTTSQPSPQDFVNLYKPLLEKGFEILSIHISSKLSGTIDSALQAKNMFPGKRIEVFDSLSTAMALGFQVLTAARVAKQGKAMDECLAAVQDAREKSGVYFIVANLEYLRRGGRLGGAAALLGTVLDLKPILEIREGKIEATEKVRTMNKAIDRMLDMFEKKINEKGTPIRISALFSDDAEPAKILLDRAKQRFEALEIKDAVLTPVSPVIGCHVGPGTLGICFEAGA